MPHRQLLIGNKNYSSWSLRVWLLMRHFDIAFDEVRLSFNDPEFHAKVRRHSPLGKVPVLSTNGETIWDSLAIAEYLHERFPEKHLWPRDPMARARARCLCAEMHSGFLQLRSNMPMNIEADLPGRGWNVAVQRDIDRVCHLWRDAITTSGGPFLFGGFSVADAYYAPVCLRFVTYHVPLEPLLQDYVDHLRATRSLREWVGQALTERDFVLEDEPYRTTRG